MINTLHFCFFEIVKIRNNFVGLINFHLWVCCNTNYHRKNIWSHNWDTFKIFLRKIILHKRLFIYLFKKKKTTFKYAIGLISIYFHWNSHFSHTKRERERNSSFSILKILTFFFFFLTKRAFWHFKILGKFYKC